MHVFTTDSFVASHNGREEADCVRSGLEGDQEGGIWKRMYWGFIGGGVFNLNSLKI